MNWINYDRLVKHLETMDPQKFNYGEGYNLDEPNCVDCQCRLLMGHAAYAGTYGASIRTFLDVTVDEAMYLWRPVAFGHSDPFQDRTPHSRDLYVEIGQERGRKGIQNALHRLRTVAAKYPRPEVEQPVAAFVADDAAFLAACRAMAQQPVDVETEC